MKIGKKSITISLTLVLMTTLSIQVIYSQEVEVQGELKVTQMTPDDTQDNLVIRNTDGTLGTRSAASLPPPPPPIDTTRNLASDFELAKHLCDCPNLPPFMIRSLLESGYTQGELVESGIPEQDMIDAQRFGYMTDSRDNQLYKTLTTNTQTWMAENLNYGTMIPGIDQQKDNSIIEKYCFLDDAANCTTYGGLYQWDEMMLYVNTPSVQGICPTGWHLPSDGEWKTLEMELGMTQAVADIIGYRGIDQGSQLAGNEPLWTNGNLDQNAAFNSSGFVGLPAGMRNTSGTFIGLLVFNKFWMSSELGVEAWFRQLSYSHTDVYRGTTEGTPTSLKSLGHSVRCLKD